MSQSSDDAKGQAADGGVPAVSPDKAICAEAEQAATLYAAEEVFNHILGRVKAFQAQLPEDHELGLHRTFSRNDGSGLVPGTEDNNAYPF